VASPIIQATVVPRNGPNLTAFSQWPAGLTLSTGRARPPFILQSPPAQMMAGATPSGGGWHIKTVFWPQMAGGH